MILLYDHQIDRLVLMGTTTTDVLLYFIVNIILLIGKIWVCLKIVCTSKSNGL